MGVAALLFIFESFASKQGFGQLIAVMRTTLFLLGVGMLAWGGIRLIRNHPPASPSNSHSKQGSCRCARLDSLRLGRLLDFGVVD